MCELLMCILQLETIGIRCQCPLLTIHMDVVLCIPQSIHPMLDFVLYMRMAARRVRGILIHLSAKNHSSVLPLHLVLIVVLRLKGDLSLLTQTTRTPLPLRPLVHLQMPLHPHQTLMLPQDPHIHTTRSGIQNLKFISQVLLLPCACIHTSFFITFFIWYVPHPHLLIQAHYIL